MKTFRDSDLRRLASLTKYPSIETFHELDDRGRPTAVHQLPPGEVLVTEKIDGTNTGIVFWGDEFIIRSREELLTHSGDLIRNSSLGIVDAVLPFAFRVAQHDLFADGRLWALFGEVYGGRIGTAKHYTAIGGVGFRLFDAFTLDTDQMHHHLARPPAEIAAWRDAGGQPFVDEVQLSNIASFAEIPLTPRVGRWLLNYPQTPVMMLDHLESTISSTLSALDGEPGHAEGVVIRTSDRRWIRKVRFDQYRKVPR